MNVHKPAQTALNRYYERWLAGRFTAFHTLVLVAAALVLAFSFALEISAKQWVYLPGFVMPLPKSCIAKLFFGFDCPACGLTRSLISISHGELTAAWRFNPAGYVVYFFCVVQIPWQTYQLCRLRSGREACDQLWVYSPPPIMLAAVFAQWLLR